MSSGIPGKGEGAAELMILMRLGSEDRGGGFAWLLFSYDSENRVGQSRVGGLRRGSALHGRCCCLAACCAALFSYDA